MRFSPPGVPIVADHPLLAHIRGTIAPLIVLVTVTLLLRLVGQLAIVGLRDWATATRGGLAAMFCFTAVAHFNVLHPDLVRMIPPRVPAPEIMVTLTGVCELLGAAGLLLPRTRRIAAVALILFLVAVLPANIHAATTGGTLAGQPVTPLVPRVALQGLFIALVWWAGIRTGRRPAAW